MQERLSETLVFKPTRCRGHSKHMWSLFDISIFYKMKAVLNFLRGGAPPPHAGFAPQTLRLYSGIECLMS